MSDDIEPLTELEEDLVQDLRAERNANAFLTKGIADKAVECMKLENTIAAQAARIFEMEGHQERCHITLAEQAERIVELEASYDHEKHVASHWCAVASTSNERIAELEGDFASARTSREYWSAKAFELQKTVNADAERIAAQAARIAELERRTVRVAGLEASQQILKDTIAALTQERDELLAERDDRLDLARIDDALDNKETP